MTRHRRKTREVEAQRYIRARRWRLRRCVLLAGILVVALPTASTGAASPADRLVLQPSDVPGLRGSPAGARAARGLLRRILPARLRLAATSARVEAMRYRGARSWRLDVQAFGFRGAGPARAALSGWRRAQRRDAWRTARARIGTPAVLAWRGRQVGVALRTGAGFAVTRLRARMTGAAARGAAMRYARVQAGRLRAALSRTVWDRLHDGFRADGTMPTRTLLQMAAVLYGPIRGVSIPYGRRGGFAGSATHVLDRLRVARLSDRQRAAVQAAIDGRPAARARKAGTAEPARSAQTTGACRNVLSDPDRGLNLRLDSSLRAVALELRNELAARIGFGTPTWDVCVYPKDTPGIRGALMATVAGSSFDEEPPVDVGDPEVILPGLTLDLCVVYVYPRAREPRYRHDLAHEMYHCLHKERTAGDNANPAWVEEGLAEWVAHQLAPLPEAEGARGDGSWYRVYYGNWDVPLFRRTYDAIGFWGLVEQALGSDAIWRRVSALWAAGHDPQRAFEVATSHSDAVLGMWASALFRNPTLPDGWMQRLPWAVPWGEVPGRLAGHVELAPTRSARLRGIPYGTRLAVVERTSPDVPLARIVASGHVRLADRGGWQRIVSGTEPQEAWLCFGDCGCPEGTTPRPGRAIPGHERVRGPVYVALSSRWSGLAAQPSVVVEPHDLDEFCEGDEPPEEPGEEPFMLGRACERVTGVGILGGEFRFRMAIDVAGTPKFRPECQLYYEGVEGAMFNGGKAALVVFYTRRMPSECVDGEVVRMPRPDAPGMLDGAFYRQGRLCASVIVAWGCARFDPPRPEGGPRRCNPAAHNNAVVSMVTGGINYD